MYKVTKGADMKLYEAIEELTGILKKENQLYGYSQSNECYKTICQSN